MRSGPEEITFDSWGRRRIRGRTAAGEVEELFTDEDLTPGEVYLVRGRTNPLSVGPLLVPIGADLED
jgi:hypothetical protein